MKFEIVKKKNSYLLNIRISLLTKLFVFIITCCLFSCAKNGNSGFAGSIGQSKKLGVFISEYRPLINPGIKDSLHFNIKSVWIEHSWKYSGLWSQKAEIDGDFVNLIIITDKAGLKDCFEQWLISAGDNNYFACASGEGLIGRFHGTPDSISPVKLKVEKL